MLTFDLHFPFGYSGTSWDRHPNTELPELFPAPWRLFRTFTALWFESQASADPIDETTFAGFLNDLSVQPPKYLLPPSATSSTPVFRPRSVPNSAHLRAEMKGKAPKVLHFEGFVWFAAPVRVEWDTDADPEILERLAVNLDYLGRSTSLCEMAVNPATEPDNIDRVASTGTEGLLDEHGHVRSGQFIDVLIADPNETQWLDRTTAATQTSGQNPVGTKRVPYLIERSNDPR